MKNLRKLTLTLVYYIFYVFPLTCRLCTIPILSLRVFPLFLSTLHNPTTKNDHLCAYAQEPVAVDYSVQTDKNKHTNVVLNRMKVVRKAE